MADDPLNPTAWLWRELARRLPPEVIAEIKAGYRVECQRYSAARYGSRAERDLCIDCRERPATRRRRCDACAGRLLGRR